MKKYSTLQELATLANVSTATASRALRDQPGVGGELRQRILQLADEHNFTFSKSARELANRRRRGVATRGVVRVFTRHLRDYGRGFYLDINDGVRMLTREGYDLMVTQFDTDDLTSFPEDQLADGLKPDGVIVVGTAPRNLLEYYKAHRIPLVVVDIDPEDPAVSWVASDSFSGFYRLVEHLIGLGHRRIACAVGVLPSYSTRERINAYRCALLDAGILPEEALILNIGCNVDQVQENWKRWFPAAAALRFSAVVCLNDIIALGIMKGAAEAKIAVPDQLSIAGCDNTMACQYAQIPLTTVHIPACRMGENAAALLLARMLNHNFPTGRYSVETELILRESCKPYHKEK